MDLLYHRNDCKYCLCVTVYCHHTFAVNLTVELIKSFELSFRYMLF